MLRLIELRTQIYRNSAQGYSWVSNGSLTINYHFPSITEFPGTNFFYVCLLRHNCHWL